MEVTIKAIHFEMSDKLEAFVNKKVERLVRRFDSINTVEVNLRLINPETALNK
ncbi:MAG: HPF/RaiA family ribosome-associated protein, partial [Muribaculaceae bacterium]|nr:HPF/RaiA family ribosome-associated protein [Muribaculaceae bacterium]